MHVLNVTQRRKVRLLAQGIAVFPTTPEKETFAVHSHRFPLCPQLHLGILKISVTGKILALGYSALKAPPALSFARPEHQWDTTVRDPRDCSRAASVNS